MSWPHRLTGPLGVVPLPAPHPSAWFAEELTTAVLNLAARHEIEAPADWKAAVEILRRVADVLESSERGGR
jgi:hypothetical protein